MNEIEEEEIKDKEINLWELAHKAWGERKFLLICAVVGAIVGIIISISIPKEYVATTKMVSESSANRSMAGNLGALASMAGITPTPTSRDAINPQLYPYIVKSVPFALELADVEICNDDGDQMTVEKYMFKEISYPWWKYVINFPAKTANTVGKWFEDDNNTNRIDKSMKENESDSVFINPYQAQPAQSGLAALIASRINAGIDPKTSVITISATMQDPVAATMLVDTVAERLKEYVTQYRTDKARADLEFAQKLNDEAREDYYNAQKAYANYVDKNQGITLKSMRTEEERLQNEMQLAYAMFNTTSQQLQVAKAKVQEITPIWTVLEPARVPLTSVKPNGKIIILGCIVVAFAGALAWVLFLENLLHLFLNKGKQNEADDKSSAVTD